MAAFTQRQPTARAYATLSIGAALLTIGLKFAAYRLTNSVGLLSDVLESVVNLVAAIAAFWALSYAAKPPDVAHTFGHSKVEYFSSGLEGILILVAAGSIAVAAGERLFHPRPIEQISLGLALSLVATILNGGVAWTLLKASRRRRSITLRADAHHLFTDVWTSVGVVVGIGLVQLTGWLMLDPIVALLVAANIVWTGVNLLRETGLGLLDTAIPKAEQQTISRIMAKYQAQGIQYHALRSRVSAAQSFMITHLEPLEDPKSWDAEKLLS
jgi:cation diffusion facilitator family transporter